MAAPMSFCYGVNVTSSPRLRKKNGSILVCRHCNTFSDLTASDLRFLKDNMDNEAHFPNPRLSFVTLFCTHITRYEGADLLNSLPRSLTR